MKPRFFAIQIDMKNRTDHMDGVLSPVNCDGYYDTQKNAQGIADYLSKKNAQGIADYLSKKNPHLRTHEVEVKS